MRIYNRQGEAITADCYLDESEDESAVDEYALRDTLDQNGSPHTDDNLQIPIGTRSYS